MDNIFFSYDCNFSISERKSLTAFKLRILRRTYGYSQKDVARLIHVNPATLSTYETGRTEPPFEILIRLSFLYHVSLDYFVSRDIF